MKMLKLILQVILTILDIAYYVAFFPILFPIAIHKRIKIIKWRKNVKAGDLCYFINSKGIKTMYTVKEVDDEGIQAIVESHGVFHITHWEYIKFLRPV